MNDINCNAVEENLSAFWDKELDKELTAKIKDHLCKCVGCRRKFYELIKMEYLLKNYFNKNSSLGCRGNRLKILNSVENFVHNTI